MKTAERFPTSFVWANADKAMDFALQLPPGAARDFYLAIAGRMMDDRYHFAESLPDPVDPQEPTDPAATSAPFHRDFIAASIESWTERVNGPCRVSVHVPDGVQVWLGYSSRPGVYTEGQAGRANGGYEVHVPAGAWHVNVKLSDGFGPCQAGVDGFPE